MRARPVVLGFNAGVFVYERLLVGIGKSVGDREDDGARDASGVEKGDEVFGGYGVSADGGVSGGVRAEQMLVVIGDFGGTACRNQEESPTGNKRQFQ